MKRHMFAAAIPFVALLFSVFSAQPAALATEYQHSIDLNKMTFSWSIQGEQLHVKLTAGTKGWVGIGFNPSQQMKDADYILGYVKNGKVSVTDAFGVRVKEHIDDTAMQGVNNVANVSGSESGGVTTIEFSIPLHSGDKADSRLKTNATVTVLLAFGRGRDDFQDRHRYRTSLQVNLSTGQYTK